MWRGKASGDGFNFSSVKDSWDFLKDDFCDMLAEFHKGGRINKELEATFLTLIPKAKRPYL